MHRAVDGCLLRARDTVFWHNMNSDIKQFVANCQACQTFPRANQKETLLPHDTPSYAWENVGVDIFDFSGLNYLVVSDFLTDYFELEKLENLSSDCVIKKLKYQFARFGIPCI